MGQVLTVVVAAIILTTFGASAGLWLQVVLRWLRGEPLVPRSPRQEVPWGLLDLAAAVFMLLTSTVIMVAIFGRLAGISPLESEPSALQEPAAAARGSAIANDATAAAIRRTIPERILIGSIFAESLVKLAIMLAAIALTTLRTGATKSDWGWNPQHLQADVVLGLKAFALIMPPVMGLHAAVLHFFPSPKHPLLENLLVSPSLGLYGAALFGAVLIAPLVEEWAFRVLLQGWLEKVAARRNTWEQLISGESAPVPAASEFAESEAKLEEPPQPSPPPWPVIVSALFFAGVHQWPDQLPLFFLAMGLGYLYRQTHRILPSMVVHFCLNSVTMLSMGAQLLRGP